MSAGTSPSQDRCPRCGAPLHSASAGGLCPRCLVAMNLASPTEAPAGETVESGGPAAKGVPAPPPGLAEIARHFPQLEILECLGRGGMGVVYRARQPQLDRLVALKILAPDKETDAAFAGRFTREAQTLARLSHQHIVTIYDFGKVDGLFYLLMEYVDGASLRQLLETRRLSPEEALAIVPKVCEALQYAHEHGVVHRDIKPENVLLSKEGQVKIADFGIAKIVGGDRPQEALTQDRQVIGTPHYMAPEQAEKPQSVDHRADIYSLGVVFYEMLTGELPLGKFAPPSHRVQVDVRLDEVVLRALEKEPERRYQTAAQFKATVETLAAAPAESQQPQPQASANQSRIVGSGPGKMASSGQHLAVLLVLMILMFGWGALWFLTYELAHFEALWAQSGAALSPFTRFLVALGHVSRATGLFTMPVLLMTTMAALAWWIWLAVKRSPGDEIGRGLTAAGCGVLAAGFTAAAAIGVGRVLVEPRFLPEGLLACSSLVAAGGFAAASHAVWGRRRGALFSTGGARVGVVGAIAVLTFLLGILMPRSGPVAGGNQGVADHSGNTNLITLRQPYMASYPGAPTDRISLQYAVMEVCRQAGLHCDWDQAFERIGPLRTRWVFPAITNATFASAMSQLLSPWGITYEVTDTNSVILKRR